MKKKLTIVDIENKKDLKVENCDVLYLSSGKILTHNCKLLSFTKQKNINLKTFKTNFLLKLKKYLNIKKQHLDKDFFLESEISNLRNDRTNIFDKIYFIFCLKKIIKKYKFVEIIFDNNLLINTYKSLGNKNIKLICLDKSKKGNFLLFNFIFSRLKFFLRSLIIVCFSKLFLKDKKITNNNVGISLYPILYLKREMSLYKKKIQLINFNITDETHIKKSLIENLKNIFFLDKNDDLIISEKKISIQDLLLNFLDSFSHYKVINIVKNKKFEIKGIDYSKIIFDYYYISHLNRMKFEIYNNCLKKILSSRQIENFHYFMFEYSFGFFLKNKIQNINPNISFVGYQHGIFSKNLWWFDFIKKYKAKKFLPNKIIANNIYSLNDYKMVLKNYVKEFSCYPSNKKRLVIKFSKSSNNYLIIIGQHDHKNILNIFSNSNFDKTFFIKPHPRSKPINFKTFRNLKRFNIKLEYKKVLFSQTTTLHYDFLDKKNFDKIMLLNYDYKNFISFDFIKKNQLFTF